MRYVFEMLENEHWWGGTVASGACPLTASSEYHQDFLRDCDNQTMPLFLSDKGRCIWSEDPFKVDVENGRFVMEGEDITLETLGANLREAYREAQKRYFPCDGKKLPETFFRTAQYNTWIDGRWGGIREGLEEQTMGLANAAKELMETLRYPDGTPVCPVKICVFKRLNGRPNRKRRHISLTIQSASKFRKACERTVNVCSYILHSFGKWKIVVTELILTPDSVDICMRTIDSGIKLPRGYYHFNVNKRK